MKNSKTSPKIVKNKKYFFDNVNTDLRSFDDAQDDSVSTLSTCKKAIASKNAVALIFSF